MIRRKDVGVVASRAEVTRGALNAEPLGISLSVSSLDPVDLARGDAKCRKRLAPHHHRAVEQLALDPRDP